ncbi:MAG TPA: porin family protein [Flavobacterium sp.]|uniref:porin family protein n=1 Tax=Flavobacterium sp. TaxID=239 RepID=UPI002BAF28DF|nr:porin family protein [Flavobacterium sp.]HSD13018.1 porin family protein [Flavobacterium sp.]
MKKVILSLAAVFAFGFANAQDSKMRFGAKAGLNIANLTGDVENTSALIGAHVGGFMEYKLNEKFAIQPELLFSMQGAKSEYSSADADGVFAVESTAKLNYLNLPIMAKYYVAKGFSVEAGPQIGFLLSAKQKTDVTGTDFFTGETFSESTDTDVKEWTNSIDFGFNLGAGYDFTDNISAGVRYNFGLSNVDDYPDSTDTVKNGVLSVSAAYKF